MHPGSKFVIHFCPIACRQIRPIAFHVRESAYPGYFASEDAFQMLFELLLAFSEILYFGENQLFFVEESGIRQSYGIRA